MSETNPPRVVVKIEHHRCIGAGNCAHEAPAVFDIDDTGMVVLLDGHPPAGETARTHAAARACPAQVIKVEAADA